MWSCYQKRTAVMSPICPLAEVASGTKCLTISTLFPLSFNKHCSRYILPSLAAFTNAMINPFNLWAWYTLAIEKSSWLNRHFVTSGYFSKKVTKDGSITKKSSENLMVHTSSVSKISNASFRWKKNQGIIASILLKMASSQKWFFTIWFHKKLTKSLYFLHCRYPVRKQSQYDVLLIKSHES